MPAGWVVPLGAGSVTPRDAMAIGTAGFTAAMSVVALEERGLKPANGPVLVTGASGGVGGTALAILADRGYEVWAATGKPDEAERLAALGAAGILTRDEVTAEGKPLEIGALGRGRRRGRRGDASRTCCGRCKTGAAVASSGNAGGPKLETTVFPFILRGVALLGHGLGQRADRATPPAIWDRLATDLRPRDLGIALPGGHARHARAEALDGIVAGAARGRWIVRIEA